MRCRRAIRPLPVEANAPAAGRAGSPQRITMKHHFAKR